MKNPFRFFCDSKDISAVLSVLRIRASTPNVDRQNVIMDNNDGKTWRGAIVWGAVSLWQDNPIFVIICLAATITLVIQSLWV